MNMRELQAALGLSADGVRGPVTTAEILNAADEGRLTAVARVPAPVTGADDAPPWITAGKQVYGLHETRDKAKLAAWLKSDGKTLGDPTALPWCGDFAETCIKIGLPGEPFPGAVGANPYWARNWASFGLQCKPCVGAVLVFERGPTSGHVGFAVGIDPDSFHVLGGNQGDTVSVVRVARSRLLSSRWPATWTGPQRALPQMSGGMISLNEF